MLKFWISLSAATGLFLYLFGEIMSPFCAGFVIAYGLRSLSLSMMRVVPSKTIVSGILTLGFVLLVSLILLLVLPALQNEIYVLAQNIPSYFRYLVTSNDSFIHKIMNHLPSDQISNIKIELINSVTKSLSGVFSFALTLLSGSKTLVSSAFIIPLTIFYFLRDWDRLSETIESWIPLSQRNESREIENKIKKTIKSFIQGQTVISIILSIYYSIGLFFLDIKSYIVIGILTGFLSFVPFVGALFSFIVVLIISVCSSGNGLLVVALYGVAQIVEGNFLAPKLIGKEVGLHPLWIIFSLFAGAQLQGIIGMVLAIPVASIFSVLARYCIDYFKKTPLYRKV